MRKHTLHKNSYNDSTSKTFIIIIITNSFDPKQMIEMQSIMSTERLSTMQERCQDRYVWCCI